MGSMTEDYNKSQRRIRDARIAQQSLDRDSDEYKVQERIVLSEMGTWN